MRRMSSIRKRGPHRVAGRAAGNHREVTLRWSQDSWSWTACGGSVVRAPWVRLVGEVLGEPDGAGGVTEDGDADVDEGSAEDVQAVTVVRRVLVQHALGEAHRHLGDGRRAVRDRAALADVLAGGRPVHSGGVLAGTEAGLA